MNGESAPSQHPAFTFTLQEAAAVLGISLNTLRRRIAAGQVRAERARRPQGHVWRVYLGTDERSEQHAEQHAEQEAEQDAGSTLQEPPTDVLRAEAMATYTRSLLEPLVNRLAEQERTIRDQAEELGRLRERVATLQAPESHQTREASNLTAHAPDPPTEPSEPPSPAPMPSTSNGSEHAPWWRRWVDWL
jgi:excisionase family DNA binding protein